MTTLPIGEVLRDAHEEIVSGVKSRLRDDETVRDVAAQRHLGEGDLVGQVVGYWLECIGSDLEIGSTTAAEQNLDWLVRFRTGHRLLFGDEMIARVFADISAEIEARLGAGPEREEYVTYRKQVEVLIARAFPMGEASADDQ